MKPKNGLKIKDLTEKLHLEEGKNVVVIVLTKKGKRIKVNGRLEIRNGETFLISHTNGTPKSFAGPTKIVKW